MHTPDLTATPTTVDFVLPLRDLGAFAGHFKPVLQATQGRPTPEPTYRLLRFTGPAGFPADFLRTGEI